MILKTAARLFAAQGFEATTTIQIAREAGATEPLIYYHFKGKDDLFTRIIEATFSEYFSRLDALEKNVDSPFGQIQKLIELQFDISAEMPDEVQLIVNACPAKLNDPESICAGNLKEYRSRLLGYLARSISQGIESGEFVQVPAEGTAIIILSVINGIVRYARPVEFPHRGTHSSEIYPPLVDSTGGKINQDPKKNLREAAVEFCRRSLMNGNMSR